jgi:hypothetical protein
MQLNNRIQSGTHDFSTEPLPLRYRLPRDISADVENIRNNHCGVFTGKPREDNTLLIDRRLRSATYIFI